MKTKAQLLSKLRTLGACSSACTYVKTHRSNSAAQIFRDCKNLDWLYWYAGSAQIDCKVLVRLAVENACSVLHKVPHNEERPRLAVAAAEKWLANATYANAYACIIAAAAAYDAYATYDANAVSAACYASASASYAAFYATSDAGYAVCYAAAAYDAYAASDAASYAGYAGFAQFKAAIPLKTLLATI